MKIRLSFILIAFSVAFSCSDDNTPSPEETLESYITGFYSEAAKRNVTVPNRPDVAFTFVDDEAIAPDYGAATLDPPTVRIANKWNDLTQAQQEILVYHELGHAALRREHCYELLPNCALKSIMGKTDWPYEEGSERRAYYLDELFDPLTPLPSWGGTMPANRVVLSTALEDNNAWEFHIDNGATQTGIKDSEDFLSAPYSLKIHGATTASGVAYWYLPSIANTIPAGSSLIVTCKVKTKDLSGDGVWIYLQGATSTIYETTSDNYRIIKGTTDWTEVKLTLHCFPSGNPAMHLFLGIDGAGSGDVWIDNIEVDYYL